MDPTNSTHKLANFNCDIFTLGEFVLCHNHIRPICIVSLFHEVTLNVHKFYILLIRNASILHKVTLNVRKFYILSIRNASSLH